MKRFLVTFIVVFITLFVLVGCENKSKIVYSTNQNKVSETSPSKADNSVSENTGTISDKNASKDKSTSENNSGEITPTTAPAEEVIILLKQGDSGNKVTELQKKLYTIGYNLGVDGAYGNETSEVIKKLQRSNNIDITGNLDTKTNELLKGMKDVRAYTPPQKAVSPAAVESRPASEAFQGFTSIPNIKTSPGDSQQVIVVLAQSYGTINATFNTYEKINGFWQAINSGSAVTGIKGFSDNRREGDLTSPTGKYGIPFLFGSADNPGTKLTYRKVQTGDYWVSNKIIEEYNVWIHYDGADAKERFYDYEALWSQPLYKYAAVIDFNYGPGKVLGKGSGIFLHIAPPAGGGTLGCIGVSEPNLLKILRWLDPAKKPVIIMGVKGHI